MLSFLAYIQSELYVKDSCEVESIDPIQYTSDSNIVGFANGDNSSSDTVPVIVGGFYNSYSGDSGDVHISGNLIVDGTIDVAGNSNLATGHTGQYNAAIGQAVQYNVATDPPTSEPPKITKEEPPEDPIDNRFDILDL
jgi:hypothetical protein